MESLQQMPLSTGLYSNNQQLVVCNDFELEDSQNGFLMSADSVQEDQVPRSFSNSFNQSYLDLDYIDSVIDPALTLKPQFSYEHIEKLLSFEDTYTTVSQIPDFSYTDTTTALEFPTYTTVLVNNPSKSYTMSGQDERSAVPCAEEATITYDLNDLVTETISRQDETTLSNKKRRFSEFSGEPNSPPNVESSRKLSRLPKLTSYVKSRPRGSSLGVPTKESVDYSTQKMTLRVDMERSLAIFNSSRSLPEPESFLRLWQDRCKHNYAHKEHKFCFIQRKLHLWPNFLEEVQKSTKFCYSANPNFGKTLYEPQYFRSQIDSEGVPFNSTRMGLCPYCSHVNFLDLKRSAYGNHLAYNHGILTNGYVVPNPIYPGYYMMAKNEFNKSSRSRTRKTTPKQALKLAFACPACYQLVEAKCTKKSSVFGHYLRHFRDCHINFSKDHVSSFDKA
ncbi:uncharacterized protein RJT20DRAFT_140117 [Scheffersomyces xylosifermentans]|uniref:uncharacterized protein n=1 Tax=Scheffersomyces xylosifermentans TaxID=1304137 RepID=UPI00315CA42E